MSNNLAVSITADVADFTGKLGVAQAVMRETSKAFKAAAEEMASSAEPTDALRTRYLELSDAQAKATATVKLFQQQLKQTRPAMDELSHATTVLEHGTGNARIAQMEMMHVVRASTESFAMGISPLQIMTMEIGRVAEAATFAGGSLGRIGAFLAGPWGLVAVGAATVIAGFANSMSKASAETDKATTALERLKKAMDDVAKSPAEAMNAASISLAKAQGDLNKAQAVPDGGTRGAVLQRYIAIREATLAVTNAQTEYNRVMIQARNIAVQETKAPPREPKGRREAAPKSRTGDWENELTEQKEAHQLSLEDELKFWTDKRQLAEAGTKERQDIERKVYAAMEALRKQGNAAALEQIKANEAQELDAAKTATELGRLQLQAKIEAVDAAQSLDKITTQQALAQKRALNAALIQLDLDLIQREKAATLAALNAQLAQEKLLPADIKKIHDQIVVETQKFDNQIVLLNQRKVNEEARQENTAALAQKRIYDQTYQGFAQNIARMVTFQQGAFTTLRGMWTSLQSVAEQAVSRMVTVFLSGLAQQGAASSLFHMKEVAKSAKQAAAGAWSAVVKIPIVGPILAPIAAAAAFAGVMAFGSAEGGDWNVKPGMYELHRDEMVLPAWAANPLRQMVAGGDGGGGGFGAGPGGRGGGDIHMHFNVSALDGHSVKRVMMDNKGAVADALRNHYRYGGR